MTHKKSLYLSLITWIFTVSMLLLVSATAQAGQLVYWLPGDVASHALDESSTDLFYRGISGALVGVGQEAQLHMEAEKGTRVQVGESEVIYVYLVKDAFNAEFVSPARVLHRADHEVFLAMPAPTGAAEDPCRVAPCLDEARSGPQLGLKAPVHVALERIPWSTRRLPVQRSNFAFDQRIADMIGDVTDTSYEAVWQSLEDFGTRHTFAEPENENAAIWIFNELASMGYSSFGANPELFYHSYEQSGDTKKNVVAVLPGATNEVVYITAHFDSTSLTPSSCAPGADDNASGVVAVLEAARVMKEFAGEFQRTIKFVAFNGEEQGLHGSQAYAEMVANQAEEIAGVYNADMIAYLGNNPPPRVYTNSGSTFLADILRSAAIDYVPGLGTPVIDPSALTASDHSSFWNEGYPAVILTEDQVWGGDFCPWYHTCNDLIANYIADIDFAVNNTRAMIAAMSVLSGISDPTSVFEEEPLFTANLHSPYPSPSEGKATLSFELASEGSVELEIVDIQGRRVATLMYGQQPKGTHRTHWNGRDVSGRKVASGVYFAHLRLLNNGQEFAQKIVLTR